jgi:hypothetical protein
MSVSDDPEGDRREEPAATLRPSEPQRRYLERGLSQPGGKLPLFDADGREAAPRTVQACVANGWAEPWLKNPIKPDWLVCRLTAKGYAVLGRTQPPPNLPPARGGGKIENPSSSLPRSGGGKSGELGEA